MTRPTSPSLEIAVIGAGYVGLVTGVCLAKLGFRVTCVDKNLAIISALGAQKIPFFEPGLEDFLIESTENGLLTFTDALADAVTAADVVFVAVGTPSGDAGQADLSCVHQVVEEMALYLQEGAVVVIKSTVPVGTNRALSRKLEAICPHIVHVVSNPEFLREGAALSDFINPDRIVVGCASPHAQEIMSQLYETFLAREVPLLFFNWETAELVKYASNSFLALKIGFANEMADLCEHAGADVLQVTQGMGLDQRIGKDFLRPGPGYGGSCFPKDTRALVYAADHCGVNLSLIRALIQSNEARKTHMVAKIRNACGGNVAGKTLAILGITFKAETDDVRESPSLAILPDLQAQGASLRIYDPQGMGRGRQLFQHVVWCADAYEACQSADGVVILTEWGEFRTLDLQRVKNALNTPVWIDLRNLMDPKRLKEIGFKYVGVGRG